MGRPTDLTPEVQRRICDAILSGMHLSPAAEANGVPAETAGEWMRRGENRHKTRPENALYAQFAAAVREAEAQCERAAVVYWRQQIPDNWQAARDFLARRFPARWAPVEKQEHMGKDGGPIVLQVVEQIVSRRHSDSDDSTAPGTG